MKTVDFIAAGQNRGALAVFMTLLATMLGASATLGVAESAGKIGFPAIWWLLCGCIGLALQAALLKRPIDGEEPPDKPILIPPSRIEVRASTECEAANDPLVARALVIVARNLSHPWGVDQLSAELGVSPAKLNRHFRADLGRPPGAEIVRQRLVRAKALLRDTALRLDEIAEQCGICNAPYLSNLIRRETGLSPREYRTHSSSSTI